MDFLSVEPHFSTEMLHSSSEIRWAYHMENLFGLKNHLPDKDGLYDGKVFHQSQCWYLWITSWLSITSSIYAFTIGYYDLAAVPFGVWFTSILYWWKPTNCWRRYFDMVVVATGLTYQLYRARSAENRVAYYLIVASAVLSYPASEYFYKRSSWLSAIIHSLIHILGNVSNFVLYSGYIPPP